MSAVYHLAGVLRGSDFEIYRNVNAEGTRNVCRVPKGEKKVKRLVYISSLSAAGPSPVDAVIDENTESLPVSFYGKTKLIGRDHRTFLQVPFSRDHLEARSCLRAAG